MVEHTATSAQPVTEAPSASATLATEPAALPLADGAGAASAEKAAPTTAPAKADYPTLVLATAGVAVFDTVVFIAFLVTLVIQPAEMLALFQAVAGLALAAAIAPIILGALVFQRNRESGVSMPGTAWANYGVMIGALLAAQVLAIPLFTALLAILN